MQNQLGYATIDDSLFEKLFGNIPRSEVSDFQLSNIKERLKRHNIETPVSSVVDFEIPDLPIPDLLGDNIEEHFEAIATEQVGHFLERIEAFMSAELAPPPENWLPQAGWTFYPYSGAPRAVEYPLEDLIVFDTETYVQGGSFPIIATAVSDKGHYLWLAPEVLDLSADPYKMVPIGKNKVVVAHNASYDRIRTVEAYEFSPEPENFFLDTLSMHIATNGLASNQRFLYVTTQAGKREKYYPKWSAICLG